MCSSYTSAVLCPSTASPTESQSAKSSFVMVPSRSARRELGCMPLPTEITIGPKLVARCCDSPPLSSTHGEEKHEAGACRRRGRPYRRDRQRDLRVPPAAL